MSFPLRLADLTDVTALEELIPLSVRGLQSEHYTREQMEGALGTVFGVDTQLIKDRTYFVAEADGAIVGCGGWSRRKTLFGADGLKVEVDAELEPKKDPARVRAFFIRPGWERKGIGSEIMARCEKAAIEAGFRRIDIVATLTGELLYEKFGYGVVERYDVPLKNGLGLPVVRMTKAVASAW